MLFGMAALKSGFLTGEWDDAALYRGGKFGLAIGDSRSSVRSPAARPAAAFTVPMLFAWSMAATVPFRPLMIVGYAALIILATQGRRWLVDRIAAAGRAAFTNYLGTSILMTGTFYGWGLGLYGSLAGRSCGWWCRRCGADAGLVEAVARPVRYGPFEWLWRSLARWEAAADAEAAPGRAAAAGLNPAEALVGGLAAEAAGRGAR